MSSNRPRGLAAALSHLLEWVGEGRRLSELPPDKKGILNYAVKNGYVETYPIRHDTLINPTGRMP